MMESLICICGAGTMGRGIALSAATQGISVILYDMNAEMLTAAATAVENELAQSFEKNRISREEKENILQAIRFSGISPNAGHRSSSKPLRKIPGPSRLCLQNSTK